jgi:4-hydroxy-tetrahydrodipicolinate reductase
MGRRVIALASEEGGARVVAALARPGDARIGQDAGALAGVAPIGVALTDALPASLAAEGAAAPAVAIDFSAPAASLAFARICAERRLPLVVATTGFEEAGRASIAEAARAIPLLLAPNLSLGVALLARLCAEAARILGLDADIEIAEAHHRKKKDAPSGTALHLARAVAAARGQDLAAVATYGRRGLSEGERPRGEIGIHALRLGDVVGEHTVALGFGAERIEITHKSHSRDVFARGALRAARFLASAAPGLYGPEDLLRPA